MRAGPASRISPMVGPRTRSVPELFQGPSRNSRRVVSGAVMNINATLLGQMLAFAILIWFTVKFVWPPLLGAIEERQKRIAEGLAAAERARQELAEADVRVNDEIRKARVDAAAI